MARLEDFPDPDAKTEAKEKVSLLDVVERVSRGKIKPSVGVKVLMHLGLDKKTACDLCDCEPTPDPVAPPQPIHVHVPKDAVKVVQSAPSVNVAMPERRIPPFTMRHERGEDGKVHTTHVEPKD